MPWKLFVFPARAVWPWHLTEVNKMPLQLCNYSYCKTVSSYCWFDETLTLYHLSDLHCYSNSAQTKTMVALLIFTIPSDCSRTYACVKCEESRESHPIQTWSDSHCIWMSEEWGQSFGRYPNTLLSTSINACLTSSSDYRSTHRLCVDMVGRMTRRQLLHLLLFLTLFLQQAQ